MLRTVSHHCRCKPVCLLSKSLFTPRKMLRTWPWQKEVTLAKGWTNSLLIRASELSGSGSAFGCKYHMYAPAGKRSINLDTFNTFDDRVKKAHEWAEASTAILSAPYHPSAFCPFPGLSQKNYRITLLQSLSKHRQIPHQPRPQLWQDDLRCTATGSVRCLSERSPSSNLPICPGSLLIW